MHKLIHVRDCATREVMDYIESHCDCYKDHEEYIDVCNMVHGLNILEKYIERHMGDTEVDVKRLSLEEMKAWNAHLVNGDGTKGGHWTVEETTSVAKANGIKFDHICENGFNVAMNMIYSDYYDASLTGTPKEIPYYVRLTKDFLFDEDGYKPSEKLARYYRYVAKH